jgi:midasin
VSASSSSLSTVRCMQLVFVISDGIVGSGAERERVRQWVVEAARRGILVVLVIVDKQREDAGTGVTVAAAAAGAGAGAAAASGDSILATQSIRFVGGNVVRTPYLDDYPFPYYIVLRDTRAMPEALADALRQWFEMVGAVGRE